MNDRGLTYCRSEMKGKGRAARTSAKYCPDCGLKVRGPNHLSGGHCVGLSAFRHKARREALG